MSSEADAEQIQPNEPNVERWHQVDQDVFTIGRIKNSEAEIKKVRTVLDEIRDAITIDNPERTIAQVADSLNALAEKYVDSKFINQLIDEAKSTFDKEIEYSQSFDRVAESIISEMTGIVPIKKLVHSRFIVADMLLYQQLGLLPDQDTLFSELTNPDEVAKKRFQGKTYDAFMEQVESNEELHDTLQYYGAGKSVAAERFSDVIHISTDALAFAQFASILDQTKSFSKVEISDETVEQINDFGERFPEHSELSRILIKYVESAEKYRKGIRPTNLTRKSLDKVTKPFTMDDSQLVENAATFKQTVDVFMQDPKDIVTLYGSDIPVMMLKLHASGYAKEYDRQLMRIIENKLLSVDDQKKLLRLTADLNSALRSNSFYSLSHDISSDQPLNDYAIKKLKELRTIGLGHIHKDEMYMGAETPEILTRLANLERTAAVKALLEGRHDLALEFIEGSNEIESIAEIFAQSSFASEWDAFVTKREDLGLGIPIDRQTETNISDSKRSSREYLEKLANHGIKYFMNEPTVTGRNLDVLSESMVLVRELSESDHPGVTESDRERILDVQRSVWKWLNNDMDPRECLRLTIQYAWAESKVRQLNIRYPGMKQAA
jgi:hypothetical protein